ncbi:MAG: secretin N-terminal domain-containing protein, partial [Halanaerobiales bacterium]
AFTPVKGGEDLTVNAIFYETDLRDAIHELSIQTGINIIADQTVNGVITVDLRDVPLEKALNMILSSGGFTFRKIEDYYLVGLADPRNVSFSDLSDFEVIQLENITVKEVFNLLPTFLTNYVRGERENNVLTINAAPKELERIKEYIRSIDKPRKQIEIRLLVTEVDSKIASDLGINLFQFTSGEDVDRTIAYSSRDNLLRVETDLYGHLLSQLRLMEEEQLASIEANPYILVSDGGSARFFIGEEQVIFIHNESYNSTRAEEVKVGVELEVMARIIGEDQVYLELAPVISHFINEANPNLLVKENSLKTSLQIKNGETVCLAGMTLKRDSDSTRKVPLLGDIPLVRWLFRSENKEENERELLVFVTPIIR